MPFPLEEKQHKIVSQNHIIIIYMPSYKPSLVYTYLHISYCRPVAEYYHTPYNNMQFKEHVILRYLLLSLKTMQYVGRVHTILKFLIFFFSSQIH